MSATPHSAGRRVPAEAHWWVGSDPDMLTLERQIGFALTIATRSVVAVYRPILEPLGLTHPQYLVMLALWGESPRSVKELGRLLHLDSPTLSPLLKRLQATGLITRSRRVDDERVLDVALTDTGRALRDRALQVPSTVLERLGLDVGRLQELHGALSDVIAAARRAGAEIPSNPTVDQADPVGPGVATRPGRSRPAARSRSVLA